MSFYVGRFGFEPKVSVEDEVYRMIKLLMEPEVRARIEQKKDLIVPGTRWSGIKKKSETLEVTGVEALEERAAGVRNPAAS